MGLVEVGLITAFLDPLEEIVGLVEIGLITTG